jgi:hypothetical protein
MARPSLYPGPERVTLLARIGSVRADSPRQWGRMEPGQMLAHCQVALRVALGEQHIPRAFLGILFGRLAKRHLMQDGPLRRNLPTGPEFRCAPGRDLERERAELQALVRRYGEGGPAALSGQAHPFFGPLSVAEWDTLQWKHLDHHLRQFGA